MRISGNPAAAFPIDATWAEPVNRLAEPTVRPAEGGTTTTAAQTSQRTIVAFVMAATLYNTALALVNAHVMPVNFAIVAISEIAILMVAALMIVRQGIAHSELRAPLFLAFFIANALAVSLISGALFVDLARNASVIAIFHLIGARATRATVQRSFAILAIAVAAVLLLESVSAELYARTFEPGLYYERTRGFGQFELDELGLFANALGFEGRFAILSFVGHRTASLFLEQVSLANFSTVLVVFLVCLWPNLSWRVRAAYIVLIAFILVTNNSRTALGLALVAPVVYWIAPHLPRFAALVLMPVAVAATVVITLLVPPTSEDTLVGRIGLTGRSLANLDGWALVGGLAPMAPEFADSGYTYLIYGGSILALLAMWLYCGTVAAGSSAIRKRASLMLGLYLAGNLLIGGNAVFSIKVAAPLWFLIGFLRVNAAGEAPRSAEAPAT